MLLMYLLTTNKEIRLARASPGGQTAILYIDGPNTLVTSGASIEHLHCHIVPRHRNETGVLEMVSEGTRVIVEDPNMTLDKLREAWRAAESED